MKRIGLLVLAMLLGVTQTAKAVSIGYLGGEIDFGNSVLMNLCVVNSRTGSVSPQSHKIALTTEDKWDDETGPGPLNIRDVPHWVESFDISAWYLSNKVRYVFSNGSFSQEGSVTFSRTEEDPVMTTGRMTIKRNYGSSSRVFKISCTDNVYGIIISVYRINEQYVFA